jgi:hypothetical protein
VFESVGSNSPENLEVHRPDNPVGKKGFILLVNTPVERGFLMSLSYGIFGDSLPEICKEKAMRGKRDRYEGTRIKVKFVLMFFIIADRRRGD